MCHMLVDEVGMCLHVCVCLPVTHLVITVSHPQTLPRSQAARKDRVHLQPKK